jgi:hypothetical protein
LTETIRTNDRSICISRYSLQGTLYRKTTVNGLKFSNILKKLLCSGLVAPNRNYILKNAASISRIYEYIAPITFLKNYSPTIQLVAPTKIQVATFFSLRNGCWF